MISYRQSDLFKRLKELDQNPIGKKLVVNGLDKRFIISINKGIISTNGGYSFKSEEYNYKMEKDKTIWLEN